jgi:hypothetical protein
MVEEEIQGGADSRENCGLQSMMMLTMKGIPSKRAKAAEKQAGKSVTAVKLSSQLVPQRNRQTELPSLLKRSAISALTLPQH